MEAGGSILGGAPRDGAELKTSAARLNNRLTALHHLARALDSRREELGLDPETLSFILLRSDDARSVLLAATARIVVDGTGTSTALKWHLDEPGAVSDPRVRQACALAVTAAASAVGGLEGALAGIHDVLLQDAQALRERLAVSGQRLAVVHEPPFIAHGIDILDDLAAHAPTGEDVVASVRATARALIDARLLLAQADEALLVLNDARTSIQRLLDVVPDASPDGIALRASIEAPLRDRLRHALQATDASVVLDSLDLFRRRVAALTQRRSDILSALDKIEVHRHAAHQLESPPLREALERLAVDTRDSVLRRVELGAPLPWIIEDPRAVPLLGNLARESRIHAAVHMWPDCDAWRVAIGGGSIGRKAAADLLALAKARRSLRHRAIHEPTLQRWAVLATSGTDGYTGRALASRINALVETEARLIELEIPRAMGLFKVEDADLQSDRARARVGAITQGGARNAQKRLFESLAGKLPQAYVSTPLAREILEGITEALTGPSVEVAVSVNDEALRMLLAREAERRWAAPLAELALDLHATPQAALAAARAVASQRPDDVLLDTELGVIVFPPRPLADVDKVWKLRARIEAAVGDQPKAEALVERALALVRTPARVHVVPVHGDQAEQTRMERRR